MLEVDIPCLCGWRSSCSEPLGLVMAELARQSLEVMSQAT